MQGHVARTATEVTGARRARTSEGRDACSPRARPCPRPWSTRCSPASAVSAPPTRAALQQLTNAEIAAGLLLQRPVVAATGRPPRLGGMDQARRDHPP